MNLKPGIFLALFFSLVLKLQSQQIGGAEIYYQLISGQKYLITAQVYRQCDKAPLTHLDGFVIGDGNWYPMNFKRIRIEKIQ